MLLKVTTSLSTCCLPRRVIYFQVFFPIAVWVEVMSFCHGQQHFLSWSTALSVMVSYSFFRPAAGRFLHLSTTNSRCIRSQFVVLLHKSTCPRLKLPVCLTIRTDCPSFRLNVSAKLFLSYPVVSCNDLVSLLFSLSLFFFFSTVICFLLPPPC